MSKLNQKHSAAKIVAPTQEEMPFAVVQGKNLTALPKDLYIPPGNLFTNKPDTSKYKAKEKGPD